MNNSENLLRRRAINFWNLTSSLVISAARPMLKVVSVSNLDDGTLSALYNFFGNILHLLVHQGFVHWKVEISVTSTAFTTR